MFLKEGMGGHGREYIIYIRARDVRVDRGGEKHWENLKAEDRKCKAKV